MIGDKTGLVEAELPKNDPCVKEGVVVKFNNMDVNLVDGHIRLVLSEEGYCQRTNMKLVSINM
jgi:hypothetical protein